MMTPPCVHVCGRTHLAVAVSGTTVTIYMNGAQLTSASLSYTTSSLGYIGTGYIGRMPKGLSPDNYFDGWVKDFRVYDSTLRSACLLEY